MIILIDGFWGSGKTTLRYLLDGHSELKVSPSQESIISAFERNQNKSKFYSYKDIRLIREFLATSYYYNLELESSEGYLDHDINRKTLSFDFYEFEKYWINKLRNIDQWDTEKILNTIYSSIIKFYYKTSDFPINDKKVIVEDNNFNCHKFFLNEMKDSKLIVAKRSPSDNLVSLLNRATISNNYKTEGYKKYSFNYLVRNQHFPIRINKNYEITEQLKKEFPGRIYECEFKNLIYNTEDEMKKISKFLDITYEDILLKATHFGENIRFKNGDDVLNKEKYTAKKTFSDYQIKLIEQFEKKFSKYNFLSLSFLEFIFIKSFYLIKLFSRNIIKFFAKKLKSIYEG